MMVRSGVRSMTLAHEKAADLHRRNGRLVVAEPCDLSQKSRITSHCKEVLQYYDLSHSFPA
jgi:hypothetical protein